jgi:phage FluMu gp28-like protein
MAYKPKQIESLFSSILSEIEAGASLRSALKKEGRPGSEVFYRWLDADPEKAKRYARACELRADAIFEDILDIADDSSGDKKYTDQGEVMDSEFVQRSKLRVDARKWIASKLNPKKYGDKQETTLVFEQPLFPD